MKKFSALLILLALLCGCAGAEGFYALLGSGSSGNSNPLPDIYEKVSPAVVVLARVTWKWDAETDTVKKLDEGSGSAVYIDERGYFLTNYHVIEDCDELEIRLENGDCIEAFLVGGDEATDVAVVKIEEEFDAKPVAIGSSSALRVGELISVIGTPLDETMMYNTMTVGFVSGLNRNNADPDSQRAVDLIQIDAAINPGNSGGALLNSKGELVGIPFMKYMYFYYEDEQGSELEVYDSLGFAVPMDTAWPIVESIIDKGVYNRPRFGVSVQDIEGPDAPLKNYPPAGMKIVEVEQGGSGYKAGLRADDVITHVNGTRIKNFRDYTKIIDKLASGESFEITVVRYKDEQGEPLRKFETLTLTVTLEMID